MIICYINIISCYQYIILLLNHIIILITNLNAILASGYKSIKNKRSRLSACPLLTSFLPIIEGAVSPILKGYKCTKIPIFLHFLVLIYRPCFKSNRSMTSLCDDLRFNLAFALLEELIKQVLCI